MSISPRTRQRSAISCRYLVYTLPNGRQIRLPLLHIRLSHNNQSLTTIALIDSGATTTFIPLELAQILALPTEHQETAVGAGGTFTNTIRKVNLALLKGKTPFAKFTDLPVYVPTETGRIPYAILGRDAIFRKFDITFRENQQRTVLRGSKKQ